MNDKDTRDLLVKAIEGSQYRWRTPRGIAKDSGVPFQNVLEVLERSDAFVRARKGNARGEPLYSTRERQKDESTLGKRVLAALTNRIVD